MKKAITKQVPEWMLPEEEIEIIKPDLETPPEGKAWRNKVNGYVYAGAVNLGKILFLDGKFLDEPIVETPEHYELIDIEPTDPSTV